MRARFRRRWLRGLLGGSAFLLACGLTAGCLAPKPRIIELTDDSSAGGTIAYGIANNLLITDAGDPREKVEREGKSYARYLDLGASFADVDGQRNYWLRATYGGEEFLLVEPGESLVLWLDGRRLGLTGDGSVENRSRDSNGERRSTPCVETAHYFVTADVLERIADAQEVEVELRGTQDSIRGRFASRNREVFREFVARFIRERK